MMFGMPASLAYSKRARHVRLAVHGDHPAAGECQTGGLHLPMRLGALGGRAFQGQMDLLQADVFQPRLLRQLERLVQREMPQRIGHHPGLQAVEGSPGVLVTAALAVPAASRRRPAPWSPASPPAETGGD